MHAMLVRQHGDPNVLQLVDLPVPTPTNDLILVQHKAIGVNFVDTQHQWDVSVDGGSACPSSAGNTAGNRKVAT